jgi:hypothetical protein
MTNDPKPTWDLLLVVTNDHYGAERFGTVRRIIDATLGSGRSIQIWACGTSNTLTDRPASSDCCPSDEPSTADVIANLVDEYPDRFSWIACKDCCDDRGGADQIAGVLTEPGFVNFHEYVDRAAKTVYIGGVR